MRDALSGGSGTGVPPTETESRAAD
jgi:hypothetical protein